jgi:long-chain acyl-CoA synthetase
MLSNRNILTNLRDIDKIIKLTEEDVFLSFLPLSHVYERTAGYYLPLSHGCKIAYAENMLSVGDNLPEVHPTVMVAVPRFFEKMRARVVEQVEKGPALKRKIFNWALGVGSEWFAATRSGNVSGWLKFRRNLADKLVFSKIKEKLGGRLRFFVSGAAPLQQSLGEFFFSAGVLILEGYGLTETSPVIAVNHPDRFKFGTVGLKLDSVELKIADDGEILVKGDSIMLGYYNKPEETAEVMEDGWFHTGDIGFIDEEGFLKITDRKKNIIVTSGGKNVAPQPIEGLLTTSPYIEQALLVGDQRNFISALIVPNFEKLEEAAQVRNLKYRDTEELVTLPALNKLIGDEIERLCQGLGRFERPRKFVLLGREFSIEAGEMTPSLKIKRNAVLKLYDDIIEKIYSGE